MKVSTKLRIIALSIFMMSSVANAATSTLGNGPTNLTVAVNRVANSVGAFNFLDIYKFNVSSLSAVTLQVTEVEKDTSVFDSSTGTVTNISLYNIENPSFSYSVFDSTNAVVSKMSSLSIGDYQIRVSGTADGFFGGQYALNFNTTAVTPIPEPSTSMLFGFGLLLLGATTLRKLNS